MVIPSSPPSIAQSQWHRFSQASIRAFHSYATWLVSLSWKRFFLYAILLMILTGIMSQLPPFNLEYTETLTASGGHHRSMRATPPRTPPPPMPAVPAAPPAPAAAPASAASAASAAPAASGAVPAPAARADTSPLIHITKGSDDGKSVNIHLPGIVIEKHGDDARRTGRRGAVDVSIGPDGIHIRDAGTAAPALAASAAAASSASAASAASAAIAGASAAAADERIVEMQVGDQHIRIGIPANADTDDVRAAVEEARDQIADQLREARDAAQQQADAVKEAQREGAREAAAAARGDDEGDDGDDDGPRTRVHHLSYGDGLPKLAMWWVVFSVIVKLAYKGRLQAETKAAVMAETAEAESLRRQVIEARMAMMQAQVEPHFLFNTLASIDHLIEVDPKRASRMQRNLIALLRASMPTMREAHDGGLRPLEREMAVIRPYLEILQVRMEERLTTSVDVPDGLHSAEFPPMMIQTLVENAIKHGLEPKPEGGHLSVKAEIRHGKLVVTVADTGLGFTSGGGQTAGTGVGLANVRERLTMLYGSRATLTITDNPGGGTIATITVPYTTRTPEEGASS